MALLLLCSCSPSSEPGSQDGLGQPSDNLAFTDASDTIASALIADTLVADAAGARCAGERIAGQLTIEQQNRVQREGTLGGLDLSQAEAARLVDTLFDCTDPREGVIVGMHAAGLDPVVAACIGRSLDSDIYSRAMTHSFSDGSAPGLQELAADFDRATAGCR